MKFNGGNCVPGDNKRITILSSKYYVLCTPFPTNVFLLIVQGKCKKVLRQFDDLSKTLNIISDAI